MPKTPRARASVSHARERALLRRRLLRSRTTIVCPGLIVGDTWIPGVAAGERWLPDPTRLLRIEAAVVLGLDQAPGLRPRQVREWARAGRDPRATWEAVAPLAIDNPWIALLVAPLLDEIGAAHAEAPGRARALRLALAEASRGLDRARRLIDGWGESLVGGWSRSGGRHWRVGSLDRLLRLESAAASRAVRRLTAVLTTTGARLVRLESVPAFRPPRGKTRRVRPWTSAAMRLDAFVRRYNHGRTDHAVIVAALEWHGFDLGAGSLGLKKQRVAQVLARRRPR